MLANSKQLLVYEFTMAVAGTLLESLRRHCFKKSKPLYAPEILFLCVRILIPIMMCGFSPHHQASDTTYLDIAPDPRD